MVTPGRLTTWINRLHAVVLRMAKGRQPSRWLGVDLGQASIKVVELERAASGWRHVKHLIQELPAAAEGQPVDRAAWLQAALREFVPAPIHLAVDGADVIIRRIDVPPMSARELPEAVKWQMKDQLPFAVTDAALDCRVVGEVWDKDVKRQDVLVAAAFKPMLQETAAFVQQAGIELASLTPAALARWSCVAALVPEASQGAVAIVDLGSSTTQVAIIKDGQVRVVRDLAIGSLTMTQALVGIVTSERGETAIDLPKAEGLKRRYGVLTEETAGSTDEGVPLFHLASLMRPVLEQLMTELGRLLDFYNVQMDGSGVRRLFLCGGGANLKGLDVFLMQGLGTPVDVFNPLAQMAHTGQHIGGDPDQLADDGPRLAVAVGLALEHGTGLVFPHASLRAQAASSVPWWGPFAAAAKATAIAGAGLLALCCLAAGVMSWQLARREALWRALAPQHDAAQSAMAQRQAMTAANRRWQGFLDEQPLWMGLMKEWGALIPPSLELDELTVFADEGAPAGPMRFRLQGRVVAGQADRGGLSGFVDDLERSALFAHVKLTSSEMHTNDPGRTRFEIEGDVE